MIQLFVIAVSLALDAFSVSVAGGIKAQKATFYDTLKIASFLGVFQGGMPLIGWLIGQGFSSAVAEYGNIVAFVLLSLIGLKMIQESFKDPADKESVNLLSTKTLLLLSVVTSIDALIVGVTLAYIDLPLLVSASVIGAVTFLLCAAGFMFGRHLGRFFEGKVEIIGGIALIAIGVKLLLT